MATIQTQKFGIEIECVSITRQRAAQAVQSIVGGEVAHVGGGSYDPWEIRDARGRTWRVVADASLNDYPAHLRAEVVSPILDYADLDELQRVVRALRAAGAKATPTCSIHVHVDAAGHTAATLANLLKLVASHEKHLIEALGVQADRRARYCRDVDEQVLQRICSRRPRSMAELNRDWYGAPTENPGRLHHSRYHAVNLNAVWALGTLEFRLFNGSLHAGKIKSYIQLSLALSARALRIRHARGERRTYDASTTRYDVRVFLLGLGLIGPEFATARYHLLSHLSGSAAFRRAA
ncbi:MAG: amidoligase family protein [Deltaproteobacteria bacterium]|nr:amidoligase family protein [Deltaproteobacteria bacterium]